VFESACGQAGGLLLRGNFNMIFVAKLRQSRLDSGMVINDALQETFMGKTEKKSGKLI
jgi:hypothetical protein